MTEKTKILVVDDEPLNIKLLEATLIPEGYKVITASNGEECLAKLSESDVSLILLDIMMPGMDGFEVTRRLRADPKWRLIPIVMITALTETADRVKGIEAGCDDFISKPFDEDEVLARVNTLVKLSYYRQQLDEKEKFEYVIDNMHDGLIAIDTNMRVDHINQKARDMLKLESQELPQNLLDYLQKAFAVRYDGELEKDIKERSTSFGLERSESQEVEHLFLQARSSAIIDPEGNISSIMIILSDITQKQSEERIKQDFLSLISGKLRNPLTIIIQRAEMMQEGMFMGPKEVKEKGTDPILNNAYNLAGLVERLLTFVTATNEKLEIAQEQIEIYEYFQRLVSTADLALQEELDGRKLELTLDCHNKTETLNMSENHLKLIAGNLIDNAVIFNKNDPVKIHITVENKPETLQISFKDNGIGISNDEEENIFEKFYQIKEASDSNIEGFGLGLPLVKRLVTTYGGKINVVSSKNKGSTFTISLPRKLVSN